MNLVVIKDASGEGWWLFQEPRQVIQVFQVSEVLAALREVETAVESRREWAAGFISYEAAPAFDSALPVRAAPGFPLLWFGLYSNPQPFELPALPQAAALPDLDWQPSVSREEYERAIAQVKHHIARGDTYQVNYTLRLRAAFDGEAWALFLRLAAAQPTGYSAYIDTGALALCSASPELFFRLDGDQLTGRPMKGTAARGRTLAEDRAQAQWLQQSEKNRAENVMIVDMLRNDLGRVADIGSVQVAQLFQVERYPTLWQMTSTVQARSRASFSQLLAALFPCASITGAPKPRTMRIIADLENSPRRAYTGGIGYYGPGRQARFSVAIRTATLDRRTGQLEYGAGGGIVWDSTSADEYVECLLKAHLVTQTRPQFELLETLLWTPQAGFYLLDEHLKRLAESAEYFAFALDLPRLHAELNALGARLLRPASLGQSADAPADQRVRLLLALHGQVTLQAFPLVTQEQPVRLGIAAAPVDSANPFLYHKTSLRQVYQDALAGCPGCDDALLWNERGQVTETTIANLVYRLEGRLFTPPVACGLLPGTLRAHLLAQGRVQERALQLDELPACEALWVINSVRGWRRAVIASIA